MKQKRVEPESWEDEVRALRIAAQRLYTMSQVAHTHRRKKAARECERMADMMEDAARENGVAP